jgi:AraC family transcriptional regulator of adaptative response/methylated-DNA-[protein]-cysteine methyltransferase
VSDAALDIPTYRRMEKAIRFLEEHRTEQPTLADLSAHVGMSPFHLQRVFRGAVGVSPKRFLQFVTAEHARRLLEEGSNLLETSWAAGLSGPGRLHDLMVNVNAMTPAEVRAGGEGVDLTWGIHDSPLGPCALAATSRGIAVLAFLEEATDAEAEAQVRARWPEARLRADASRTKPLVRRIFEGEGEGPLSLHLRGTNFQIRVWEALLTIPAGRVVTYGGLAEHVGVPGSARAVGRAVGANPVAVAIPCHRVVLSTGALGGYRWGRARKMALLAREHEEGAGAA